MAVGRNDPCPCGSGKKYKSCCLAAPTSQLAPASMLRQVLAQMQAGQWGQAEQGCLELLRQVPEQADALHMLGLIALQRGQSGQAAAWLQRALAAAPQPSALLQLRLGVAMQGLGRLAEALACYEQALALQGDLVDALNNRGRVLHGLHRLDEAAASYRQALILQPGLALAHFNLGRVLHEQGDAAGAEASYRQALHMQPGLLEAHLNLGTLWRGLGRLEEAEGCYRQALALQPGLALACFSLGLVLQALGRFDEAISCYQDGLVRQADNADAWNNFAVLLHRQGRLEQAEAAYRRALALQPGQLDADSNLADLLCSFDRPVEAEAGYRRVLAQRPESAQVLCGLGTALMHQDRCTEAALYLQQALQRQPDLAAALVHMGRVRVRQGLIEEGLACYRRALEITPGDIDTVSALFVPLQYSPDQDQAGVFSWQQRYAELIERSLPGLVPAHDNDRSTERRLKIGYVSPDFHDHAAAYFIEPVLAQHERERFEIFCYYNNSAQDQVSARLQKLADHWRPCRLLGDEQLAALIRADGIDILVDLAGHSALNRLPVFARRPAPIQLTWLGYLGSTGLKAIDYRLTDAVLDPPGATERFHAEALWRLPAWSVFQPAPDSPPVNALPALHGSGFMLASLNNLAKINADVISLWARILHALPDARLLLGYARDAATRERLLGEFAGAGIAAGRVELVPALPLPEFLALHHRIDLALDPFPFNGGATTGHALWMGVPVITLAGNSTVSRQGASIMQALGLQELVALDADDYLARTLALAGDLPRLQALRAGLRERMAPERRGREFTRHLEQVYGELWAAWCRRDN
jgi:predicted O-linked N-acetylglucosamine transferase (SPINDLY family)